MGDHSILRRLMSLVTLAVFSVTLLAFGRAHPSYASSATFDVTTAVDRSADR
ncbi:MAG: hypothetical protein AAFX85_02610 [Pseudomonadota bacterium]